MFGGINMIAVHKNLFDSLTETSKKAANDFIDFLYHKERSDATKAAINEALSGNTVGPFNSVEELMKDLYEDDWKNNKVSKGLQKYNETTVLR